MSWCPRTLRPSRSMNLLIKSVTWKDTKALSLKSFNICLAEIWVVGVWNSAYPFGGGNDVSGLSGGCVKFCLPFWRRKWCVWALWSTDEMTDEFFCFCCFFSLICLQSLSTADWASVSENWRLQRRCLAWTHIVAYDLFSSQFFHASSKCTQQQ